MKSRKSIDDNDYKYAADFELAIAETKFGQFNIWLLCLAMFGGWASIFTTSVTSFIVPLAECDLQLSLQDKGWLTGVVYAGMISSGYIWGLWSDRVGRRKLLIMGFLVNAVTVVMFALTHSFTMMLIFKFLDGFTVCGPHAILTTTVSEFHCAKHRAKILLLNGVFICSGTIIVPLLGLAVVTNTINLNLFDFVTLHSWNIFVLLTALPSFISGIGAIFMPESPKFLMTHGRNGEALNVFQKIYSRNTNRSSLDYPVKSLVDETESYKQVESHSKHAKLIFKRPYGIRIFLITVMHFAMLAGSNIIRLWYPQILATMDSFNAQFGKDDTLCAMMEFVNPTTTSFDCHLNINTGLFVNSMIPGILVMVVTVLFTLVINRLGKNTLYLASGIISGCLTVALYFAPGTLSTIIITTIGLTFSNVNVNIMVTIIVDLFPTNLRVTALSLALLSGRVGSMIGNMVFPFLLKTGCLPPFLLIGLCMTLASLLITFLPKTDLKALV